MFSFSALESVTLCPQPAAANSTFLQIGFQSRRNLGNLVIKNIYSLLTASESVKGCLVFFFRFLKIKNSVEIDFRRKYTYLRFEEEFKIGSGTQAKIQNINPLYCG